MRWVLGRCLGLAFAALAAWSAPVAALAQAPALRPAVALLGQAGQSEDAATSGFTWTDASGQATVDQVARAGGPARFAPAQPRTIHALGENGALWIHFRLLRSQTDPHRWLLAFPMPVLDRVTVYQQDARGQWLAQSAGDTLPVASWPEGGRYPHFRLDLPAGQVREVYVRIQHFTAASFPAQLLTDNAFDQAIQVEYLAMGAAFGALLLLIVACIVQSLVYRDRVYAWYAAYAGITTLAVATYSGVAAHLLWPGFGALGDALQPCLGLTATGAALLFVRNLTAMGTRYRKLDRLVQAAGIAGPVLAVVYPFLSKPAGLVMAGAYLLPSLGATMAVAFAAWRRGDVVGAWVLAACMPYTLALSLAMARMAGLLPVTAGSQYAVVVAMAIEVPLLLVALSIRSRERHGAQIRELALSSQDALTGLLAPHLFHDRLRQVVARYKRDREDAAVVYIDLVNYARIKEFYGSAVAEQSLLRSVIKLRRLLRDVDTVSRIGEARFALILEGVTARAAVTDRAARLIAAGLMPLKGLKPDVTLQFHIAGVLLRERVLDPIDLGEALSTLLGSMSPRTRRPIRFLEPEETQPAQLGDDSSLLADDDSVLPQAEAAAAAAAIAKASRSASRR